MKKATQRIRYLRTADGVQLAWAEAGTGPTLIKAANWMTHLEYEWESPVWRHWMRFFSDHFRFIRHDERGCGMTDWNVGDLSFERWVEDLEALIEVVDPPEPFALLGISQGAATCIAYTVKHPERVSRHVLYGGYARGSFERGDPVGAKTIPPSGRYSLRDLFRVPRTNKSAGSTSSVVKQLRPTSLRDCWKHVP